MSEPTAATHAASSEWLLGTWQLLRCEAPVEIQPGTTMRFSPGAALEYRIPTPNGDLQVTLRWRMQGGALQTVHEDGSNPVQVAVSQGEGDVLIFDFGGPRAWFVRVV